MIQLEEIKRDLERGEGRALWPSATVQALVAEIEQLRKAARAVYDNPDGHAGELPEFWREWGEEIPVVEIQPRVLANLGEALGVGE